MKIRQIEWKHSKSRSWQDSLTLPDGWGGEMSTTNKSEHVIIEHTNESPYPIPYGQLYCPICNGQIDTGFRCMGCGRQSCPPKGQVFITMPDGWELSKEDV